MSIERNALQESQKTTDGGFGILDAFQGCFEDTLKEFRKVQCEFLNSKPPDDVLPKCEIKKDDKGEFLAFAAVNADKKSEKPLESIKNFDEWLDGKTRLQPQAA